MAERYQGCGFTLHFTLYTLNSLHTSNFVLRTSCLSMYELPDIHLRGSSTTSRSERRRVDPHPLQEGSDSGRVRELQAFFGLRFYALVCWKAFGVIPAEIRLVYLSDPAVLTLDPHELMLVSFERQMQALGKAIGRAVEKDDWRSRPSPFCMSFVPRPLSRLGNLRHEQTTARRAARSYFRAALTAALKSEVNLSGCTSAA